MMYNGKKISKRMTAAILTAALTISSASVAMAGEWKEDSKGWWYQEDDGTYPASDWKEIDGRWYYFDGNGYMRRGWVQDQGTWYFMGADGAMSTNQTVEGFQLAADGARIDEKNQLGIYVKGKTVEKETKAANGAVAMKYSVTTPLVTIAGNPDVTNKINSYFNDVKNRMEEVRAGYEAGALEYYNIAGQFNNSCYEVSHTFESLATTKKYLSFSLTSYEYTGGAHGISNTTLVTFDTSTGDVVNLGSMAMSEDAMKEKILNYAAKKIASEHPEEITEETVKAAGIEQWCVVDDGLKLLYNQYSIASYAAGQIEVTVPYSEYSMYTNGYGRGFYRSN